MTEYKWLDHTALSGYAEGVIDHRLWAHKDGKRDTGSTARVRKEDRDSMWEVHIIRSPDGPYPSAPQLTLPGDLTLEEVQAIAYMNAQAEGVL